MSLPRPSPGALEQAARNLGMHLGEQELRAYDEILQATFADYDVVDALIDAPPVASYARTPGVRVEAADNPLNAWYVRTEIDGKPDGPLAGKRVVLKDNVCLAGVPMMNGASSLRGYTPDTDATVVARMLDAGARIVGKAHCEFFCVSGSSHTGAAGPVRNPRNLAHSAGGSSSGAAALVAAGEAELAIGTDQGGSVRIPAAYSGIVGMKPTWGLIPYTGIMPIEMTLDHAGIMSANVADNALLLDALAGPDGLDPRQHALPVAAGSVNNARAPRYAAALEQPLRGLRIGVVPEGFGWHNSQADVDDAVRAAARRFAELDVRVDDLAVPMHRHGHAIWTPIAVEGTTQQMKGYNYGTNWKGLYVTSLMRAQRDWQAHADDFPPDVKSCLIAGEYFYARYGGQYYAKAQNLARKLGAAYDAALEHADALLMPTVPMKAPPLPPANADARLWVTRALEMNANTAPFDVTGHPAISVPCASRDGLPVGMMLVGRRGDEATLYRLAHAFERAFEWTTL
ncbi:amidase [Paraburkholderia acidisoli]|uniref:Amidase n=1 Tax=Paraburkholderia acidisoli TaxID=2571748 RepID=A0A7Z2GPE2_9BURK|nr:amidase [Paraburkholderia acidisoli]QGZ65275.1 amidase [Paraburkholderia acidisoli]